MFGQSPAHERWDARRRALAWMPRQPRCSGNALPPKRTARQDPAILFTPQCVGQCRASRPSSPTRVGTGIKPLSTQDEAFRAEAQACGGLDEAGRTPPDRPISTALQALAARAMRRRRMSDAVTPLSPPRMVRCVRSNCSARGLRTPAAEAQPRSCRRAMSCVPGIEFQIRVGASGLPPVSLAPEDGSPVPMLDKAVSMTCASMRAGNHPSLPRAAA